MYSQDNYTYSVFFFFCFSYMSTLKKSLQLIIPRSLCYCFRVFLYPKFFCNFFLKNHFRIKTIVNACVILKVPYTRLKYIKIYCSNISYY